MPSETVQRLRQQLREKFPAAHRSCGGPPQAVEAAARRDPPRGCGILPQAVPAASSRDHPSPCEATRRSAGDETGPPSLRREAPHSVWKFESGTPNFPPGAITEISPAHPACGLTLLLAALLAETPATETPKHRNPAPLVLIDTRDRFDPASHPPEACRRLLWLRCHETRQALQAADLLLRDGNLPFVLIDLSALPVRELRRIPTATWHRLRQLAETSACTLLALTPAPFIPRAALRLRLTREFTLRHLDLTHAELLPHLHAETTHRRARIA